MNALFCFLFMLCCSAVGASGAQPSCVTVNKDFVQDFSPDLVANSSSASSSQSQESGGISLPGIFLHPQGADDAIVSYAGVSIPEYTPPQRTFLVFRIGFRDNIPWDTKEATPNGVRFMVAIDETVVFSMEHKGVGWQPRAIDMQPWAGRKVRIELRTNAIDGNSSYDWAVFGQPMLVTLDDIANPSLPADNTGLAMAQIACGQPSRLTLKLATHQDKLSLEPGSHWIPITFDHYGETTIDLESGDAALQRLIAAPFAGQLILEEFAPSTPLITEGRPFTIIYKVKNTGLGYYESGDALSLIGCPSRGDPSQIYRYKRPEDAPSWSLLGEPARKSLAIGRLAPSASQTFKWEGLVVPQRGLWDFRVGSQSFCVFVFDPEPKTPDERPKGPHVSIGEDQPIAATVGNEWSRLCFVVTRLGGGIKLAYAIAETWNGVGWQRVASLFPLAQVPVADLPMFMDPDGADFILWNPTRADRLSFKAADLRLMSVLISSFQVEGNALVINALGLAAHDSGAPLKIFFVPDDHLPLIHIKANLATYPFPVVSCFSGPVVLAGDRAYGARKDFAIFPGLEYLEGDEWSSSERDLAPPLNDRRVPEAYKITTPLMAVQGNDTLAALLWDEKQEWASGEKHPAAHFDVPNLDSGYECSHMSVFAPSVGKYAKENTSVRPMDSYESRVNAGLSTTKAHSTGTNDAVIVQTCLVLDSKARYAPDSVVNGPHKGALVLQAMQHWFDVYGMPEPSPQPREWDAERALCRDAYLHAVWSEDPPGWGHCAGWKPGPYVGHSVPLTLDLRAGVDDATRTEVQRRIDAVIARALNEQGKHFLWSNAACHIMIAELPFYYGFLPESLLDFRKHALDLFGGRENGLWVWRPRDDKTATLGKPGDHTLGQAAYPSFHMLRAARMTGDRELLADALDAMRQMEQYEIPRGAQTWECPLYQPDILAAAYAIRAYCEAYRITGDQTHLAHARYWAWTGLPFIYMWNIEGCPTMRYNVISVIGSTFYRHSWIGLPVVWCGLVYAYALQDLAEFDNSFDWKRVAQGITNSAMWQQYTDGPSKGTYPDSWDMVKNKPNPADINPENIMVNEFRMRGQSPEIRSARFQCEDKVIMLNASADIVEPRLDAGVARFTLRSLREVTAQALLAEVPEPKAVSGAGDRVNDSEALQSVAAGWLYSADLQGVIIKTPVGTNGLVCEVRW